MHSRLEIVITAPIQGFKVCLEVGLVKGLRIKLVL